MSTGLYRPEDVRDNCGFGLIAHMQGKASHELLATAIESLTCMKRAGADGILTYFAKTAAASLGTGEGS